MINIQEFLRFTFTFVVAFLITFTATPIVKFLAYKWGAVDVPKDDRRVHKKPIPRLGGLAIFYGFIVSVFCFADISTEFRGILTGACVIVVLGIFDDIFDINPAAKLAVQIFAALVAVNCGVRIDILRNPFSDGGYISFGVFSYVITVLWIVGITNAVNFMDGLDGLAVGISSITAVTLITISLVVGAYEISVFALALAGAGFGFLPFNFYPAKIFMGDTGSTFLGFMLACLSVLGLFKLYAAISFAIPVIILGLPIFDTGFAIMRRIFKGQSPMLPDRGHLHHMLIDLGFTQKHAVSILYIATSLLSLSAVVAVLRDEVRSIILICSVLVIIVAGRKLIASAMTDDVCPGDKNKVENEVEN